MYLCIVRIKNDTIYALIDLIDDPDLEVYDSVCDQLINYGSMALPELKNCLLSQDLTIKGVERIQKIIDHIEFTNVQQEFKTWVEGNEKDLITAIGIISKCQFPDVDIQQLKDTLYLLRKDIWLEISQKQTSFESIKVFNRIFFDYYGFRVNPGTSNAPFNYFPQMILEDRVGSELGVGLIYSIVAQSLNLPVYGVVFPWNRFYLAHIDQHHVLNQIQLEYNTDGVLFYLDMSNNGSFMDKSMLVEELNREQLPLRKSYFEPSSNTDIVRNFLQQLILTYHQWNNQGHKAVKLEYLLQQLERNNQN